MGMRHTPPAFGHLATPAFASRLSFCNTGLYSVLLHKIRSGQKAAKTGKDVFSIY